MPIDCTRLLTSETWMLGSAEEKVASFTLWAKSWHQVPSASLPDNDRMLSALSEAGIRWAKVRNHALRGWVKCSDGRLYHPVVAEKANEAWASALAQKARTEAARLAKWKKRQGMNDASVTEPVTESVTTSVTEPVTGSIREEKTIEERKKEPPQTSFEPPQPVASPAAPPPRQPNGTRLPDEWEPDDPAFAGCGPNTLAKFRDYWRAQPGAKGRKTDWQATWRNWCRSDAERRTATPARKTSALTVSEQNMAMMRLIDRAPEEPDQTQLRIVG
jgi:hypothetical protein